MLKSIFRIAAFLTVTLVCIVTAGRFHGAAAGPFPAGSGNTENQTTLEDGVPDEPVLPQRHREYEVIVTRNIFSSYVQKEPQKRAQATPLEQLQTTRLEILLLGTITGREGQGKAVVLDKKKQKQKLLNTGDLIQGAQIKEVLRGKIVLHYQGNDEILRMIEPSSNRSSDELVSAHRYQKKVIAQSKPIRPRRRAIPAP